METAQEWREEAPYCRGYVKNPLLLPKAPLFIVQAYHANIEDSQQN
jgi:hypothetical protein